MWRRCVKRCFFFWLIVVAIAPYRIGQAAMTEPKLSSVFNDSLEHQAIVRMLKAKGKTDILQTATSVSMNIDEDFADVSIDYSIMGDNAVARLFLFKEKNAWTAYLDLPTDKDHPAVFLTLAGEYCTSCYRHFQGIGYHDDSWKSKDPKKRIINIDCSELIENKWVDHPVSLIYEYSIQKGWHIIKGSELGKSSATASSSTKTDSKKAVKQKMPLTKEESTFSDAVVDRFFLSILQGDMEAVEGFLDAGMSPNVKRPRMGDSPLYTAILGRKYQIALMILNLGGDADFKDQMDATPLLRAAGDCESIEIVKALLAAGADVNAKARGGGTPLMMAETMQCKEIVKILRKAGAK